MGHLKCISLSLSYYYHYYYVITRWLIGLEPGCRERCCVVGNADSSHQWPPLSDEDFAEPRECWRRSLWLATHRIAMQSTGVKHKEVHQSPHGLDSKRKAPCPHTPPYPPPPPPPPPPPGSASHTEGGRKKRNKKLRTAFDAWIN